MTIGEIAPGVSEEHYRSVAQRQARLVSELKRRLYLDVQDLTDVLGVSVATIRRDLRELEEKGLLQRTHGGATIINQVTRDNVVSVREVTNVPEKRRIAAAAAELIIDGDALAIDSGTTSLEVAHQLISRDGLTFLTNGTDVLAALAAGGVRNVHMIGGEYVDVNHSMGGVMAAEFVRRFNVDKAILSVASIDLHRGLICTLSPQMACVQQAMIEIAQSVIVVADNSKFDRSALSVIASLDDVDYVVTDDASKPLTKKTSEKFRKKFIFA